MGEQNLREHLHPNDVGCGIGRNPLHKCSLYAESHFCGEFGCMGNDLICQVATGELDPQPLIDGLARKRWGMD